MGTDVIPLLHWRMFNPISLGLMEIEIGGRLDLGNLMGFVMGLGGVNKSNKVMMIIF